MARGGASIGGGSRVRTALKRIGSPSGGRSVEVGIVKSAKYPVSTREGMPDRADPPYVAEVAFWNEFGTKGGGWGGPIPSRPFMRLSIEQYLKDERVKFLIKKIIDPKNPKFTDAGAKMLGELLAGIMKEKMLDPSFKPNAPATVEIKTGGKGGVSTPLIDERILTRAIDYAITG